MPCKDVERALKNLGFEEDKGKGTSHRQFRKIANGHLYKTTLDCHKGSINIRSMIKQIKITKKEFYEALISNLFGPSHKI